MRKKNPLDKIPMSEVKRHLKEENELLDSGAFAIGSKGYDNVCERISLLETIISRKKKLKKVV